MRLINVFEIEPESESESVSDCVWALLGSCDCDLDLGVRNVCLLAPTGVGVCLAPLLRPTGSRQFGHTKASIVI